MDPSIAMWLNIGVTALGAVSGVAPALVAGSSAGQSVVQVAGLAFAVLGALNTALHASSSSKPGPLGK